MSLLRWHTPTSQPVVAAKQQPAPVSSDRLTSLMKQTHYQDSNLTDLVELDILAEYNTTFPARWTDDMRRQPKRYVYQMMAELEVEKNPVGATQLAQELLQQLLAASGDRTPMPRDPPIGESVRDHLGADNIVRHMHRTPSAYNRGPPVGKDPYLGTGLNPAHVSGVVSPNDGVAPEMACCGQPLGSPGCWIPLETGQLKGVLIPYKVWFSDTAAAATVWQQIILNPNVETLIGATVTGTAFFRESYYRELDIQIRALVRQLAPAIVRVHQQLLASSFTQPSSGVALLSVGERESLAQLVALVQRYNAPQMGACHHDRSITGDYLDEHVFFISVGREEFRAGRLMVEIEFRGRKVPLVGQATAEAFRKTTEALPSSDTLKQTFLFASKLVSSAVTEQQYLQRRGSEAERVFGLIERGFNSIGLPNVLQSERVKWSNVYQAANQLAQELEKLIGGLPLLANNKLRNDKDDDGFVQSLDNATAKLEELKNLSFPRLNTSDEISNWFTVSDEKISAAIAKESFLNQPDIRNLPQVQRWARAVVVQQNGVPLPGQEVDRLFEIAKAAALQEKVRQEEAAATLTPQAIVELEENEELERLDTYLYPPKSISRTAVAPFVLPPGQSIITQGLKYEGFSCSYDSLFAALFMIPNQWFRNHIADSTTLYSDCPVADAQKLHDHIVQVIEYMEQRRTTELVCPVPRFWDNCMHTRPASQKTSKVDEPWKMLNSLMRFYNVQNQIRWITFDHGDANWVQNVPLADQNAELLVVRPRPMAWVNQSMRDSKFVKYSVKDQLDNGRFTLTSCILYTTGHYEVAVRDPVNKKWFRFNSKGESREIGENPNDIRETISVGPYQPVHWFYVRTERLLEFNQSETNPLLKALEDNRRKFHETRSIIDAESDYIVLVDILEKLEKIAPEDVKKSENFYVARRLEYFDNKTWQKADSSFGLAGFIISFLLGYTGVLPDASLRVIPLGSYPYSDREIKESVAENVQKYRLAWESIRPIFIPLFKSMGLLAMDDWSSYRDNPTVDESMKKWEVDKSGLVEIWKRISKLLKIAAVPPTTASGQFNPIATKYRGEFIATHNALWNKFNKKNL